MDQTEKLEEILAQCAQTHHLVYQKVDGSDSEWALWYAHWLMKLSDLPNILPTIETESELIYALVHLYKKYTETDPQEKWPSYCAKGLLEVYS